MTDEHRKNDEVILTKMEAFETLVKERFDRITEYMVDQKSINNSLGKRITTIELAQANQMGKFAMVSILLGSFMGFVSNWLANHINLK
jgi:hypothetical protein